MSRDKANEQSHDILISSLSSVKLKNKSEKGNLVAGKSFGGTTCGLLPFDI